MTQPPDVTSPDFFEGFARYKLVELAYRTSVPHSGQPNLTPTLQSLTERQVDSSELVYADPSADASWAAITDLVAAQRERILSLNSGLDTVRRELLHQRAALESAIARNSDLSERLTRSQARQKGLATQLRRMKNSRSWKVTKPLRRGSTD